MNKREKIALSIVALNTFIMGIGMFTMHHIFNYSYEKPEMTYVLFFFEIIMSIVAYVAYKQLGLSSLTKKYSSSIWIIPYFIIFIALSLFCIFTGKFSTSPTLLTSVFLTSVLVGFSEELLFRGIVLPIFMEKRKIIPTILISSLCFSLFHIVNPLGGTSIFGTLIQLFLTLIFGIIFSCMFLQIKNIIPLMIFHFFWDFVLVSQSTTNANTGFISNTGVLLNLIIVIPFFIYTVKKYK